jgi:hypothetical protein
MQDETRVDAPQQTMEQFAVQSPTASDSNVSITGAGASASSQTTSRARLRKWMFRALAVVVGVLAVELILDIGRWISPRVAYMLSPPWLRVELKDDVLRHRMSPYYPGNDAWGFRNPQVPEFCEVLAIGDSNTYGFATTPNNSWPRQLERRLGVSTYNMSCGSYGFCQYEVLLARGLSLRPSTVILGVTVGNDFRDAYNIVYNSAANCPAKRFKSNDAAFVAALRETDRSKPFFDASFHQPGIEQSTSGLRSFFALHSSLYGMAREIRSRVVSKQYYSVLREDDPPQDAFEICLQRPGRVSYNGNSESRTILLARPDSAGRCAIPNCADSNEGKRLS